MVSEVKGKIHKQVFERIRSKNQELSGNEVIIQTTSQAAVEAAKAVVLGVSGTHRRQDTEQDPP